MITGLGIVLGLVLGAPETAVGTVRVHRGVAAPEVVLAEEGGASTRLLGELAREVQQLQASKVEIVGERGPDGLSVLAYVILDVGGGQKPFVGTLTEVGEARYALRDGAGDPIPLNLSPKTRQRLAQKAGAKLWVVGEKLLSGELKVTRYGILREPVTPKPSPAEEAPAAAP